MAKAATAASAPPPDEKALVAAATNAVAVTDGSDYGEFEGQGFENTSKEDFSLPFFGVLQGLSPQCETVDGAKPGKIINTVTNDLTDGSKGLLFVPCVTKHVFVEWKPKEQGGGLVAIHELDADVVVHAKETQEFGEFKTPAGNDLIETFYVYGVHPTDDLSGGEQGVIAFTSTKIKKYKAWLTKARGIQIAVRNAQGAIVKRITPPLFAHVYNLKTVKEKNTKGEFWNWDVSFQKETADASRIPTKSALFESCVATATMVNEGKAKVNYANADGARETGSGSGARSGASEGDDPPF